ncbi:transposase family protein [Aerococcus urinaeequi]|uniref:Transposase family protein n=1 Tax=Aerococcus urinaeequi TaxID=51665 RepID=A0AAF0BHC8_9LACT|nr:transposase family protein [Aerococcus urinaeequi]WCG37214.1 transposase family protein [Aerococcus urinaeequi]
MNKSINTTLQLKDENIIFEDKVEEMTVKNIKSLIYFGRLDVNPQYCPACDCIKQGNSIVKNGSKKSRITLTQISGLPAYLELRKQRYHCRECNSYFTAKSEIVGDNCFISKRVKRMVLDFATNALTLKHIAETCNVSDHTVQWVIDGTGKDLKPSIFDALPEHIAFDEFKGVKHAEGNMSFVFIDNTNSQIIDVLGDRRKFKLRDYFFAYPLKARQKVQTITIGMCILYWDYQSFKLLDWLTNTGNILDYLLNKNLLLKNTYNVVHNLREALQENYSEAFKAQLAQSKLVKLPSGLRRVLRTFINLQILIMP